MVIRWLLPTQNRALTNTNQHKATSEAAQVQHLYNSLWPAVRRPQTHKARWVPLSASTFHFIIHQLLVFLLASNKSNDPESKTSSCTIHVSASSLHFHRSNYKCLFSILIVISFDRTYSLSLKARTLHTILSSFSPSLAANSIAYIRVSNSFKLSRANLRSCIVWGVISRLQEQESKHASLRDTRGWSLSVERSSAPFPLLWGDTSLPALSPAQISFPFQCAQLSETRVFPHSLFCPCPGPVASPEKQLSSSPAVKTVS